MIRYILLFFAMLVFNILPAQNWLDSLDNYARERISPPQTFYLVGKTLLCCIPWNYNMK
ncbi:MAG: hypothetical protein IPN93_07610 [Bacteroidetes bacterium]|nr:hypothetical protein [Bacteroidota bacterium]